MRPRSEFILIAMLLTAGCCVFLTGLTWGLPSRSADPFLFGQHSVWTGSDIVRLAGPAGDDPARAADVSGKPLPRDRAIVVTETDAERARIIRRYRLMSYQPDEFATFAALSRMHPSQGDLDPRMYKYGGLWIYPVGALLKAAAATKLAQLKPDIAWYLDHPKSFGRFYVIARCYSALWGLAGIVVVYLLVRRICGSAAAAFSGAACFMLMPIVINAAHEAKPHLAGAVLMLLAVLAAVRFAETGWRRSWLAASILCGAAIGMVPSALAVILVLPGMVLLRRGRAPAAATTLAASDPAANPGQAGLPSLLSSSAAAVLVALLTFGVANPYVLINLVRGRAVLGSNLENSAAFYHPDWSGGGVANAAALIVLGMSALLGVAGAGGAVALGLRAIRMRRSLDAPEIRRRNTGLLLALPAAAAAAQFVLFARAQPADYARFALPLDIFLAIEAAVAIGTFIRHDVPRAACLAVLVLSTGLAGAAYLRAFIRDSREQTSRLIAAAAIRDRLGLGSHVLATREEPAPWSLPPVDLFRWKLVLPPRTLPQHQAFAGAALTIGPAEVRPGTWPRWLRLLTQTPISWADRPFDIDGGPPADAAKR